MEARAAEGAIDGRIETAVDGALLGWAWRQGVSDPVEVEVLLDGERVATVTADEKRGSLRRAGIGNGRHSFSFQLPSELANGGKRRLEVIVVPDGVSLIPASGYSGVSSSGPWSSTRLAPPKDTPPPPGAAAGPRAKPRPGAAPAIPAALEVDVEARAWSESAPGVVESVSDGVVAGWAPEGTAAVTVIVGDAAVADTVPDVSRPDLGEGRVGFRIELPEELRADGPHLLSVEAGGEPLVAGPHCLRPTVAPGGGWAEADLRLGLLDDVALDPGTPKVEVGGDGWLFEEELDPAAPDGEALRRLNAAFGEWAEGHRELGVPYVAAVLPARERLEREYLPPPREPPPEFLSQLAVGPGGTVVDLRTAMERARSERQVFLRTGSGPSAWGAIVAARAILAAAAAHHPDLSIPAASELPLAPARGYRGDLAGRRVAGTATLSSLGEDTELLAAGALTALRAPTSMRLVEAGDSRRVAVFECESAPPIRAVLVGEAIPPVLIAIVAERFGRCVVFDRRDPPLDLIELELPHAAFHVLRERDLPAIASGP